MFQAARLAQQLARGGRADRAALAACLRSILVIDAVDTMEVFGGVGGLAIGLRFLRDRLGGGGESSDLEIARYVVSMLHLVGELRRLPAMQEAIRRGVESIEARIRAIVDEGQALDELADRLAELYTQTLSTLAPRIIVNGEQGYLSDPGIAAKVRAALFAGIRAAWLWRQLGGSRWQLLFSRRRIAAEAARILEEERI
jgi:high frequency lysogenization protein